jgi:F420-0:gamma-glutamyl ligase
MIDPHLITAGASLIALCILAAAVLKAWQGWLDLKERELGQQTSRNAADERGSVGTARIEIADLKERIRKLEAIASGVEL